MGLDSPANVLLHILQLVREGFHITAYLLIGYSGVNLRGLDIGVPEDSTHSFDGYTVR